MRRTTELLPPLWWLGTTEPTPPSRCFAVFSAVFLGTVSQKVKVCRAACHLNATSFDPVIWSRINAAGRVHSGSSQVGVGDTARPPPHVRFPTPKRQHCRYSRDSLGTVLSETVATVSLSAPSTIPCSEQLAHSRTAGMIWIWKPRHPPVLPVSD